MIRSYLFLLFILFQSIAFCQEVQKDSVEVKQLEEVVITATKTYRQLSSLPMPVQLISKKEVSAVNSQRLNDILNEQTGLITVSEFVGGEGIQMQGLKSDYTLVLIDGVPLVGRSAGVLDISRLTVGNIKQIEIVKGASSSLYGSEALGGVINIITDSPKINGFKGSVNYKYASFNTHDVNLSLNYKKEKFSINVFNNLNSSDGYDLINAVDVNTVDPYIKYTSGVKLKFDLGNDTDLTLSGRYYIQDQVYEPTEDLSGKIKQNDWSTHLKINHKYDDKWSSYFEFYATRFIADEYLNTRIDNVLFSESYYDEVLIRPEIRGTFKPNDKGTFSGGIGLDHETLDRTDFSTKPNFNSPYAYLQYDAHLTDELNVILGARFDKHSEYKSQFSPKIAAKYDFNHQLSLKGSIGYGFRAPDFRQLYFTFSNAFAGYTILGYNTVTTEIPNLIEQGQLNENNILIPLSNFEDSLKPENSVAYNFGLNYNPISSLSIDLNLFKNNIKDLIDTQRIANKVTGNGVYSYLNVNKVFTQGVECNVEWKPSNQFKIAGGYQLLFAKDKDAIEKFESGEAFASIYGLGSVELTEDDYFGLPNRSKHMANFKIFYTIVNLGIDTNLRGTYRSKYGLYDTNGTINGYLDTYDDFVSPYTIWDWALTKNFNKKIDLGIGIDNLLDYTDLPESNEDQIYIGNIPGRILYTKLNFKF